MSVCQYCGAIGGTHTRHCPAKHAATEYNQPTTVHTTQRETAVRGA